MLRKLRSAMASFSLLIILLVGSGSALASRDFGQFQVWYSDAHSMGFLAANPNSFGVGLAIDLALGEQAQMLTSKFGPHVSHALGAWEIGKAYHVDGYDTAELKWIVLARATANSNGIPANVAGLNVWTSATYAGSGTYLGWAKDVYRVNAYLSGFIWDTTSVFRTDLFTNSQWNNVAAHEHGHGIGFNGHQSNTTQLMWGQVTNTMYPQSLDKAHMRQLYPSLP